MSTTAEDLTTVNLENQKEEAEAAKDAAQEVLDQAVETKAAAEEASSTTSEVNAKISELIGSLTTAGSFRKRRDVGTTASYDTPTDCAGFISMVADMTTAITGENYSTATKIGTALVSVDSGAVSCSSSEISSLEDQQTAIVAVQTELTAAIAVLDTAITTQTSLIETLEETISAINEALKTNTPLTTQSPLSTVAIGRQTTQEDSTIPPASSNGIMSTTAGDLTTVNLENQKEEAEAAKGAAQEVLDQAEETKVAAEEASSTTSEVNAKISELIGSLTTAGSNRKRREVRATASYD